MYCDESLFSVDQHGYTYRTVDRIINHRSNNDAISKANAFVLDANGKNRCRITLKGWDLLVKWADGSQAWLPLSDLKEAVPINVAEYAVTNKL